jgi:polyribonucleotide nucleotidyltransferase
VFKVISKSINWGGRALTIETGKIARQAESSVVVKYGDTHILCTVCVAKKAVEGADFFPLSVHFQEKYYAVGKFPGGFFKRESKPSEKEVLISRLIDRSIRPLFHERFLNEVQVVATTLSYDKENSTDITAMIGCFAALAISGLPVSDIVSSARVGYINGNFVLNPLLSEVSKSDLDLVVAGTKEGILMVESEASELSDDIMLEALTFGHKEFQQIINLIQDFKNEVGSPKNIYSVDAVNAIETQMIDLVKKFASSDLATAFAITDKSVRSSKLTEIKNAVLLKVKEAINDDSLVSLRFDGVFKSVEKDIVRSNILNEAKRIDGRKLDEVRKIAIELDLLPTVHGSALFTRGETQALVVSTLGTEEDEQMVDDIDGNVTERFLLHYNFPPFSVGECGRLGAPGRREVGHGKLAYRALTRVLPKKEEFPYTIRIVSEITESNGSSSMATVCGSSLALMSCGVPIKRSVAGIAMGLIKEGDKFAVLTDILGDEDHLGDMDFKVAGTSKGITALQMDIKITSITHDIMTKAIKQANEGRNHILAEMSKIIEKPRDHVSNNAPKCVTFKIDKDKIKDVIGSGGKVIKEICETNSVKIDISNVGIVKIFGTTSEGVEKAKQTVLGFGTSPEVGTVCKGKVVKVLDFGAFVSIGSNKDGFLHISEITSKRNDDINDYIKIGDEIDVKIMQIDEKGKIRLSAKNL